MKLTSIRGVKNLLRKYHLHPSKKMGQNFLIDKGAIKKVIESAQLSKNDIILEIGPGIGVLTMELAKKVKKVIAIEKDPRMCEILGELLECWNVRNVELVEGDILKLDPKPYTLKPYKVVANLPFYLTAPVIRKFLETIEPSPQQMVLVAQKEVGQRICAKPPEMSILAVSVQFYVHPVKSSRSEFNRAGPEIISYVSRKSFWPSPKVDSAIIRITPRQPAPYRNEVSGAGFRERFFEIVKAGFSHPRKQLINNLSHLRQGFGGQAKKFDRERIRNWLLKNNVKPSQRAETLTVENWISLTRIAMKAKRT